MFTPAQLQLIEKLASRRIQLEQLFQHQADAMRHDLPHMQEAYLRHAQSAPVQCGWKPPPEKMPEYLEFLERICAMEPKTFDDRIQIGNAAFALMMHFNTEELRGLSPRIVDAICARANVLDREAQAKRKQSDHFLPVVDISNLHADGTGAVASTTTQRPTIPVNQHAPLSWSDAENLRRLPVSATQLALFRSDPSALIGRLFVQMEDDESVLFKVVKFSIDDTGARYDVLFSDCGGAIIPMGVEMLRFIEGSLALEP